MTGPFSKLTLGGGRISTTARLLRCGECELRASILQYLGRAVPEILFDLHACANPSRGSQGNGLALAEKVGQALAADSEDEVLRRPGARILVFHCGSSVEILLRKGFAHPVLQSFKKGYWASLECEVDERYRQAQAEGAGLWSLNTMLEMVRREWDCARRWMAEEIVAVTVEREIGFVAASRLSRDLLCQLYALDRESWSDVASRVVSLSRPAKGRAYLRRVCANVSNRPEITSSRLAGDV